MSNATPLNLAHQLQRSVTLASRGELRQQKVLQTMMRDRTERKRLQDAADEAWVAAEVVKLDEARGALLDHYAREARTQLTEQGLCCRCLKPLDARELLAMLPDDAIATHAACERGAA